jgi:hypothetical protein
MPGRNGEVRFGPQHPLSTRTYSAKVLHDHYGIPHNQFAIPHEHYAM